MKTNSEHASNDAINKEIFSLHEAAEEMKVSEACIYKAVRSKKIGHFRSRGGKLLYFKRQDLYDWMFAKRIDIANQ